MSHVKNIFTILFFVTFLIACTNQASHTDDFINENRQSTNITEMDFDITHRKLYDTTDQGISFGIFPGLENTLDEVCPEGCWGSFVLERPQDFLTASVVNYGLEERSFILKLFYNYEEVAFQVLGSEEFQTEFLFSLDVGVEAHIHFQLEDNLEINMYRNKLTAALFSMPEYYAGLSDWEIVDNMLNMIINFELSYGFDTPDLLDLNLSPIQIKTLSTETGWFGLHIIDSLDPDNPDDVIFPNNLIQGSPGEILDLGFIVDLSSTVFEPLESYLLLALLDWQQVEMTGSPYLFISIDGDSESFVNYGRFSINLPEEPGFYELILIGIANPHAPNTQENYFPQETSQRITIQVK